MNHAGREKPTRLIVIRGNSASGKSAVAARGTDREGDAPAAGRSGLGPGRNLGPETLRRHATKPQAAEYGEREMRAWYRERDLLPGGLEQIIPAASPLDETVRRIVAESGL